MKQYKEQQEDVQKNIITRTMLLRNQPEFVKYMVSNLANRFGDSIDALASSWFMYQISNNPGMSALVLAVNYLPSIFFAPFLGALVERKNKKYILCIVDFLRVCIVSFYILGSIKGFLSPLMILGATFLVSTIEAFGTPAVNGLIMGVLDDEYYEVGVSMNKAFGSTAELVGQGVSGIILAMSGVTGAFLVDGIVFIISVALKISIKYKEKKKEDAPVTDYLSLLKEGIKYLYQNKKLPFFCVVAAILNCFLVPFNSFLVPYVSKYMGGNANIVSICSISLVLGVAGGAYLYGSIGKKWSYQLQFSLVGIAAAVAYGSMALLTMVPFAIVFSIFGLVVVCVFLGSTVGIASSALGVLFMREVSPEYMARASAIFSAISVSAMPITSGIMAAIVNITSIKIIFIIFSIFCILFSVIVRRRKELL